MRADTKLLLRCLPIPALFGMHLLRRDDWCPPPDDPGGWTLQATVLNPRGPNCCYAFDYYIADLDQYSTFILALSIVRMHDKTWPGLQMQNLLPECVTDGHRHQLALKLHKLFKVTQ